MIVRLAPLVAFLLVVLVACGDSNSAPSTTPATTTSTAAPASSTTEPTTTTTTPSTGTIADMVGARVEDPLTGTGFHTMDWAGPDMTFLRSTEPIAGGSDRLAVAPVEPPPTIGPMEPGALLMSVWIETPGPEAGPSGVAVYLERPTGWEVRSALTTVQVLEFLQTTTDYQAVGISQPVAASLSLTSWGVVDHGFVADVVVHPLGQDGDAVFEGEVECLIGNVGPVCTLLSDDGVLRPGDEGEAVEALQEHLIALGYYVGEIDGDYGPGTEAAIRDLQRDYRLVRDGKAGPNTLATIEDLVEGTSDIVMAGPGGVGEILFGVEDNTAYAGLIGVFGTPDATTGWYVDACDGHDWFKATWDGFTAIFTDRDGFRQFDGWHVDDVSALPDWLYFSYGIGPGTDWADLESIGAGWEPAYGGVWYQNEIGYNNGRLVAGFSDPPAGSDQVASFGTGTGAFVSC